MSVILLTGSRTWAWPDVIYSRLCTLTDVNVMIHGDAEGADSQAREQMYTWNQTRTDGRLCTQVPIAYFGWLGKAGGHERNRVMLHMLKTYEKHQVGSVHVEAFSVGEISYVKTSPRNVVGGTSGTLDMIQQALDGGVRVHLTWAYEPEEDGVIEFDEKWLEPKPPVVR